MKKKFKFALGERVFILGRAGVCIVTGRGEMDYLSGGKLNQYQVAGAHCDPQVMEQALLTPREMLLLQNEKP